MAASGRRLLTGSAAEIAETMFAMDSDSDEIDSEWQASTTSNSR